MQIYLSQFKEFIMKCHEVDYKIIGDDMQVVEVELDHLDGKLMVENNKIKNVYRISENENIQTLYSNLVKELSSF